MHELEIMASLIVLLITVVGFFVRSLIKSLISSIEDIKNNIAELNKTVAESITKERFLEKEVDENKEELEKVRERLHRHDSRFNVLEIKVAKLRDIRE